MITEGNDPTDDTASAESIERAELLEDIRVAEEQSAQGEAIDHNLAREMLLARFRR